ncbi:MAG: DUF2007 domain-containing protein [Candidatus Kapabacteria bacterium]|nr:DUF2007 domain-containing protein [Candidatus Kapabacteria bacterium]
MGNTSWVQLCSTSTEWEARVLCGRLQEEGVPVQIVLGGASVYALTIGPLAAVHVYVAEEFLAAAQEIIKEMDINAAHFNKLFTFDDRLN